MRNRFSKWSRHSSRMVCLLAACGALYACHDEYLLDDEKPTWLNSSIYESLQEGATLNGKHVTFNTYLRLLGDKAVNPENVRPLTDVLSRTGSKTVFVADDDAWDAFFKYNATLPESNPWHYATSYDKLSVSQKKLLIHTSMLNNAIVMENLASSEGSGSNRPIRGEYMRRFTDVETTDSISHLKSDEIPYTYNPNEKDYWQRFREENGGNGIYMVVDSTLSMMLHFTSEHMAKNTVNDNDFSYFMGRPRVTSDVHIYDAKLIDKDAVCENGYVNITEKPLVPLASMAEVIRTNGRTKIFSHMLDRYCAPYYSGTITRAYKILHPEFEDSIFVKRYFSDNSFGHRKLDLEPGPNGTLQTYAPYLVNQQDPSGKTDIVPSLKFDPAWNGFYDEVDPEKDMAAMFVPNDEAMWNYFTRGGGLQLVETYGDINMTYENEDDLFKNIDMIPLGTLQSLINLIMMRSFVGSVPSKMTKLRDDAQEQLFYAEDIDKIDTCFLASNGAVYIMNDVYGPADFTSVTSPAYISRTNKIIKWAIYDENKMSLNYYAYLKAMQSEFTFFLPSDSAMAYYYDPTSFISSTSRRAVAFTFNSTLPNTTCYRYSAVTGTIGNKLAGSNSSMQESEVTNRLKDILESHTIVHDGTNPIHGEDEYFLSKNGAPIKVVRDANGTVIQAMGGLQLENQRQGLENVNPGVAICNVKRPYEGLKNGQTYILDAPLVPTYRSVYSFLTGMKWVSENEFVEGYNYFDTDEEWYADDPYAKFFELTQIDEDLIRGCGLVDDNWQTSEQNAAMKKFRIFFDDKGLDYNIQFFNNYRYTAFIPTNEAIEAAIANGLPTWQDIEEDYRSHVKMEWSETDSMYMPTDSLATAADSIRIAAKITYLTNFIRYHFADNSVFADKSELPANEMVTGSYDKETGLFCKLVVERVKEGGETVLKVWDETRDASGQPHKYPTVGEKNVLARDISCNTKPTNLMSRVTLDASSACVIHSIDGVLNHKPLVNGRHDSTWATTAEAKKYIERYGELHNFNE